MDKQEARLVLQAPLAVLTARLSADARARMRRELFDAFVSASWAEQSRDYEGHLQELMTSQVSQASDAAALAARLLTSSLTFLVLILSALVVDAVAAVAVLSATIVVFGLMRPLTHLVIQRSSAYSEAQMNFASGVREYSSSK